MHWAAALIAEGGPYETSLKERHYKNTQTALSTLRRNLLPEHRSTDIRKLTRLDITTAMDKLTAQGLSGAAQDLRKHASVFLSWCANTKGLTTHNVMTGYRVPKQTKMQRINKKSKRRALPDAELKAVWDACAKTGIYGQLVRMIILGGPRRSEPTHLEWQTHVLPDRVYFEDINTKSGRARRPSASHSTVLGSSGVTTSIPHLSARSLTLPNHRLSPGSSACVKTSGTRTS